MKAYRMLAAAILLTAVTVPSAMAATTAGKCTTELFKRGSCVPFIPFSTHKIQLKFCKGGATDAAKLGPKLEDAINKCVEKSNKKLANLNCATEGDPDFIEVNAYDPAPVPVLPPGAGTTILTQFATACDGENTP